MLSGKILKLDPKLNISKDYLVEYNLPIGLMRIPVNSLIGKKITVSWNSVINCIACNALTKKTFAQGYCYRCFSSLAACDTCIVRPHLCHYHHGTCREPSWGEKHCMQDHYVYLANTSTPKVGITRGTQIPTRWLDQGASYALPIMRVSNRLLSGLVEVEFAKNISDKTNWRNMLLNKITEVDLRALRDNLFSITKDKLSKLVKEYGQDSIEQLTDEQIVKINYPVLEYPKKIISLNLEKLGKFEATLLGIKGQYLIFDIGVINIRKYAGYNLTLSY